MEIYKQLGLANQLREIGVPERYSLDEIITTGLADGCKPITRWERPSPEEVRRRSHECNDGTWPREPYLRCSQILVEKWLKGLVQNEEAVQSMFGWKLVGMKEDDDGVVSEIISNEGRRMRIRSQYVVGCDGGGSLVRKIMGVKAERKNLYVHLTTHQATHYPMLTESKQGHDVPVCAHPLQGPTPAIPRPVLASHDSQRPGPRESGRERHVHLALRNARGH